MDRQQALRNSLPPMAAPVIPPPRGRGRASFTPVSWDSYFDSQRRISVGNNVFNIYEKGREGPILFLIHGGGFSALSWALFSKAITDIVPCRCIALDLRGHGDTVTEDDSDLSAETLSRDIGDVLQALYPGDSCPPVILVGHSLGGAVAVHAASRNLIPSLAGLVVIDVVEGTALDSLTTMEALVRGRPGRFLSVENAIEWSFRSGHIKNPESACVSMIGQLRVIPAGEQLPGTSADMGHTVNTTGSISEDAEDNAESPPTAAMPGYTWRIDLLKTQPFWTGWFTGLSDLFLGCPVPKLLLLAGMDRLDKDLTIGQMQGKFQMVVLPKSGHAVQEDQPVKVAEALAIFMVRNKVARAIATFSPTFPGC
ncbi:Protein phosphatase methylesterase 1 [Hypsibius exemplaris]|uniref:Protein phosphatase methylesterase 1 n=1 Tax=Hypsibius exemplaris TaxID=2072580 RepID=A0A1W0WDN6_HYPEX|nr:Protein phosphatase methylesterase 1 [Hypsibius exemplaris]